jgi:hypothetical protein
VDIIVEVFRGGFEFSKLYTIFTFNMGSIINFLITHLVGYILLQTVLYIIPFFKRILDILFFPFRWVHVYYHIFNAKQLVKEIYFDYDTKKLESILGDKDLCANLIDGVDIEDKNLKYLITFHRTKYARQVVYSLTKLALLLFLGYLAVTPIILANPSGISSQTRALIHFYFFIGIFGVLMPSFNDWYSAFHPLINTLELHPKWINLSIIVYIVFTLDFLWRTHNFILAIYWGTAWFIIFILGLFITASLAHGRIKHFSKLICLLLNEPRKKSELISDAELLMSEDADI